MNPRFQELMKEAARLTQTGDLSASMAAIQSALSNQGTATASRSDSTVIDIEARVVAEPSRSEARAPQPSSASNFLGGSFSNKAGSRDYKLFVPPQQAGKPRALIVMLHGCTQDPDDFAAGTRMNELATAHNALVLYPAQTQQANAQRCWNWFKHNHQESHRGEPSILAGMTQELISQHGIDGDHVFVAGLSAGGAMAAILADTHPELFTAVGVHSGLAAGSARDLPSAMMAMQGSPSGLGQPVKSNQQAVPTIVFHGDADSTVHPGNGTQAAASHGQPTTTIEEQRLSAGGRPCTRYLHRSPEGHTLAEHWLVHGAGHAWSGGSSAGSFADPQGPDASEEMLRFFFATAAARRT